MKIYLSIVLVCFIIIATVSFNIDDFNHIGRFTLLVSSMLVSFIPIINVMCALGAILEIIYIL